MTDSSQELAEAVEQAIAGVSWTRDYSGGPGGYLGRFKDAVRRFSAKTYAVQYSKEHRKAPEGRHEVMITLGPPGSGSDFEHSWAKIKETCSFSMLYPVPFNKSGEAGTPPPLPEQNTVKGKSVYLGECEVIERPFYSAMRKVWIRTTCELDDYEIIIQDEVDESNPDGTETHSEGFFTAGQAAEFLEELGVYVDEKAWQAIIGPGRTAS